jgi:hypothetical protein
MQLPHCDDLFIKFLDPWYSAKDRARKQWKATRPDLVTLDGYIGASQEDIDILTAEGKNDSAKRIETMLDATRGDWPGYLNVFGEIDEHWIEAFDNYYDHLRVADVIKRSDPKDFSNDYLVLVCEFGAALGHVLKKEQPRLLWLYDWPYWESCLIDPKSGSVIPTFHWAVKKFSDYGIDDGFAQKMEMCLQILAKNPD